jgi:hypothetical protein
VNAGVPPDRTRRPSDVIVEPGDMGSIKIEHSAM